MTEKFDIGNKPEADDAERLLADARIHAKSGRIKEAFQCGARALLMRPGDTGILSFLNQLPPAEKPSMLPETSRTMVAKPHSLLCSTLPGPARTGFEPVQDNLECAPSLCPVCRASSPPLIVKKAQVYHGCPDCGCVFTPRISSAVLTTENNSHGSRHHQSQDAVRLQRLTAALGCFPGRVVDFGCGEGETARFFEAQGIQVIAIDQHTQVQLPDVADESVEGVVMIEVIEHLYAPLEIVRQLARILKSGGVIYIESSFADHKDLASWEYLDPAIGHCTVHTLESMKKLAEQNGLAVAWMNPNVCCFTKKPVEANLKADEIECIGQGIDNPLVTVAIPAYKAERFMRACLQNLSRQTIFDRCEVIVLDSSSPENERAIILEFQQKFPNIRYVRTPYESTGAALNRSLKLARGRYWACLPTDDALRDDAIEIFVAALEKHPDCALANADTAWTSKPNDTFPSANVLRTVKYPDYTPVQVLFYCVISCVPCWRTERIRQLGGFNEALHYVNDYEAVLKLMVAGGNIVHVPETLSLFYQNRSGVTQSSNKAGAQFCQVMNQYRSTLDITRIFRIPANDRKAMADAWAALGIFAMKFPVPWEDQPFEHLDFAVVCFHKALDIDPDNRAAGTNLVLLSRNLQRLPHEEQDLIRRWPKMREWISLIQMGEGAHRPHVQHALLGPAYRPGEWSHRPTAEQLLREPASLRPWISRIDGRHVYLTEDLFPRPSGLRFKAEELQLAGHRLVKLLADLPPFYAHLGGAGDALLLLASFYDQKPDAVVFSYPNSVGGAKALFEAFPKLSKIYFLPWHAELYFHAILRYSVRELKNCLGAGATPKHGYDDEWKASLNIEKKYGINKSPRWISDFLNNRSSRKVALAPQGSLAGMVGSKRNVILPEFWPHVIAHLLERGFEPVILGVPTEAKDYPALPGCADMRGEDFSRQMRCIGECVGLVGADSWAKTFSALAKIPTIVFEPLRGTDIANWKDPSDWVFIEPWSEIKMVRSLDDFRRAFDACIAKISSVPSLEIHNAAIVWEGSFLDYGSLSHINRELTARLAADLNVTCVGRNILPGAARADLRMRQCAARIASSVPDNASVTVRHQWPPNWSKPASGSLVVIQPWEFGMLPKAWVDASANVDEFWVPSPIVRAMYVNSGIPAEKVRVVPNGVDTRKFRPDVRPLALATKKKFKFLFVGGTIFRKGPDILLEAFLNAFTAADDVCLVIKDFGGDSFYHGQTAETAIRTLQQKAGAPEILYLKEELSSEEMPSLYTACDCLVLPYRGEGFGMPVLEAMSCGLPVIVTAGGATDSFVSADAGWKIPSTLIRLTDRVGEMQLVKPGWMLQPGKLQLAEIFKFVAKNPDECRRRGTNGRAVVERRFDWDDIAAEVAHRLKEIAGKRPVSSEFVAAAMENPKQVNVRSTAMQPPVALIGQLDEARGLLGQKKFQAAWETTLAAISKRPFHPEAFLLLAEISVAAGHSATARQCALSAADLAPAWKMPRKWLKKLPKGAGKGPKPDWLNLPDTIKNWKSRPKTLSVCLIVKNEEQFLAQCLRSVRDVAHQFIVVDTGSTDRTVEIAKEFGAEIYTYQWNDDFSAARNAALEHATCDWILMLDGDEEFPAEQHPKLLADMRNPGVLAFRLPLVNSGHETEGQSFVPRLFRNVPGAHFSGRIHEQVFPSLLPFCKLWGLQTVMNTAAILHHGYNSQVTRDRNKIERNLTLLRRAYDENPDDVNLTMNLGLELVRSGNLVEGVEKYREAFQLMSRLPASQVAPELREVLLTQFTSQLYKIRGHEEVIKTLTCPQTRAGGLTASLHFALGLSHFELGQYREAVEQIRLCLAKRHRPAFSPINTDILTSMPNHCLALALSKINDQAGAEKAFQAALAENGRAEDVRLDYVKFLVSTNRSVEALHKMHELVAANCRNSGLWRVGGEIALSRPEYLEFARDWTGEAMRYVAADPVIVAQRAEALMLIGDTTSARDLWEQICNNERSPRAFAALILCETIESQTTHAPDESEEFSISRAFISWYQRLIAMRAKTVVERLNEQLDRLSRALPTAARRIEEALAQMQTRETLVS